MSHNGYECPPLFLHSQRLRVGAPQPKARAVTVRRVFRRCQHRHFPPPQPPPARSPPAPGPCVGESGHTRPQAPGNRHGPGTPRGTASTTVGPPAGRVRVSLQVGSGGPTVSAALDRDHDPLAQLARTRLDSGPGARRSPTRRPAGDRDRHGTGPGEGPDAAAGRESESSGPPDSDRPDGAYII